LDEDGVVEGYEFDVILVDDTPVDEVGGGSTVDKGLNEGTTISLRRFEFNGDGQ
jgi:hypothetical protein